MNELKSYTEYAVSTPTADFVIGFDFNYGEDAVNVTVDDVPATEAGYTVVYLNETTIRLSPSVPSGVVRLQRETDIDQTDHAYRAGAKFIAQTMDENFEQLRHSQQEVRDGFSKLSTDTHEIIEGLDAALELAQDAAQNAQDAAVIAQGAADTVNTIIVGGKVAASSVLDASMETQQQVNYNGGPKWHSRVGGYKLNERGILTNGDVVKSTINGNTNDPNVDMTGWVSIGNTVAVESIADLLAVSNPKDGDVIYAKGYYKATNFALAQPFKGGGVFYYVASLSTVNNGVTIFDGWVRVLSNSTLSTYDAGLAGDISIDGLDSYGKLQALLDAAPESSTISFHGEFITSAELFVKDKKSITIIGNGSLIKADSANWVKTRSVGKYYVYGISYATLDSVTTTSETYNTGVINFLGCGTVVVENTHIYGASLPAYLESFGMQSFQGGDAGITAWACENVNINGCVIDHVFTWGILGGNITRCDVNNNVIKNCVHQSGISMNIPAGSNQDKLNIYSNYIENVGLYGVELENHGPAKSECNVYDNTVVNAFSGITATNLTTKYQIYGNRFINCYYGAWLIGTKTDAYSIDVYNNTIIGFYYGIIYQGVTKNLELHHNVIDGLNRQVAYLKTSPDRIVWSVEDSSTFLHPSALTVGETYYINGIPFTVSSSTVTTIELRNDSSNITLYRIVTSEPVVTASMKYSHVTTIRNLTDFGEGGIVSAPSINTKVHSNTVRSVNYGILCGGYSSDSTYSEDFFDNKISACAINPIRVESASNTTRKFRSNINLDNGYNYYSDVFSNGFVQTSTIETHNVLATSIANSVVTYPTSVLYSNIGDIQIYGIKVTLFGTNISSGSTIRLRIINGGVTTTYTGTVASFYDTVSVVFYPSSSFLTNVPSWGYTAIIDDNGVGTLTYKSGRITYLTD